MGSSGGNLIQTDSIIIRYLLKIPLGWKRLERF